MEMRLDRHSWRGMLTQSGRHGAGIGRGTNPRGGGRQHADKGHSTARPKIEGAGG